MARNLKPGLDRENLEYENELKHGDSPEDQRRLQKREISPGGSPGQEALLREELYSRK